MLVRYLKRSSYLISSTSLVELLILVREGARLALESVSLGTSHTLLLLVLVIERLCRLQGNGSQVEGWGSLEVGLSSHVDSLNRSSMLSYQSSFLLNRLHDKI